MNIKPVITSLLPLLLLGSFSTASVAKSETVIVAGGCFWCVESDFEQVEGVIDAVSGYTGGGTENPTYDQVSGKDTGHFEAVKITYDDETVSLKELVDFYWKTVDPTNPVGQFCDTGAPYKTALFYADDTQKNVIDTSLSDIEASKPFDKPIVTEVLPAKAFYLAEDFHQDYYKRNPIRYKLYRTGCRRDATIKSLWGELVTKH